MTHKKVLILSPDIVGERMAGPGIRYWELAHVLSHDTDVTLAVPAGPPPPPSNTVRIVAYHLTDARLIQSLIHEHDALLIAGHMVNRLPFLLQVAKPIAVDLYIPSILENLEIHAHRPLEERSTIHRADLGILNQALKLGDFFICASEKQRDMWMGALLANNRINPVTYMTDATLRKLIAVVPFGLPAETPMHTRQVLKGVHPGIEQTDRVIIWGGGVYEWLDPLTLVEAVARLVDDGEAIRLFFMGTRHPNPAIPQMNKASLVRERSEALGLLDRHVFLNEWAPYAERQNYLLEADVGITLHLDHVETRFSFRTRVLDYIWTSLPMILSAGDVMSDLVAKHQLGTIIPPRDVDALTVSLRQILSSPDPRAVYRQRFEAVRPLLTWERMAEPLRVFGRQPWLSPDRAQSLRSSSALPYTAMPHTTLPAPTPLWKMPVKGWRILKGGGISHLRAAIHSYLRWRRERGST